MKVHKILLSLILFCAVCTERSYAQKDYVITKNRDTVYCDIKTNVVSGKIKYRPNGKEKYSVIDPDNIIEYFTAADTSTFVLKKLPGKADQPACYLNWLEKGKINLYEQQVVSGSHGETSAFWYAGKDNDSLKLIKVAGIAVGDVGRSDHREKLFLNMIADFPALLDAFENEAYTFANIENCIINYNNRFSVYSKKLQ